MELRDFHFEASGFRLCLRGGVDPRTETVAPSQRALAFHGWMDHAGSFDRLAPQLELSQFMALDFSGHGLSRRRGPDGFYHFADWVQEGVLALDWLKWERCVLVGHSMGAGVACLLAAAFPERVERLVLIEGIGPLTDPAEEAPKLLRRSLLYRLQGEAPVYPSRAAAVSRLEKRGLSPEAAETLAKRSLEAREGGVSFTQDARLRLPSRTRLSEPQVLAFLQSIASPCLLVLGRQGVPFPEAPLRRRQQAIRDLKVEILDGGHHLHLDHPREVAGAVNGFLRGGS